jgi:hypothetical protein
VIDIPDPPEGSAVRLQRSADLVKLSWKVSGRVQWHGLLPGPIFAGGFFAAFVAGLGLLSGIVDWDFCMQSMVVLWPAFAFLLLVVYLVRLLAHETMEVSSDGLRHTEALRQERVPFFHALRPPDFVDPREAAGISNFLEKRHTTRIERKWVRDVSSRARDDQGQVVIDSGRQRHIIRRGLSPYDAEYLVTVLRRWLEARP